MLAIFHALAFFSADNIGDVFSRILTALIFAFLSDIIDVFSIFYVLLHIHSIIIKALV